MWERFWTLYWATSTPPTAEITSSSSLLRVKNYLNTHGSVFWFAWLVYKLTAMPFSFSLFNLGLKLIRSSVDKHVISGLPTCLHIHIHNYNGKLICRTRQAVRHFGCRFIVGSFNSSTTVNDYIHLLLNAVKICTCE